MSAKGSTPLRILINASTCVIGGGVQVAASLVQNFLSEHDQDFDLQFALSSQVAAALECREPRISVFPESPARVFRGYGTRKALLELEMRVRPDLVFTVFGPAYVRFKSPHLMGFGDAFVLVDYAIVRSRLSAWQRASLFLKRYVKRHYLQYADEYVVETSAARDALGNVVNVSPDRIHVIANAIAPQFSSVSPPKFDLSPNPLEVLAIAAPYAHKNLEIIPEVLRELSQRTARQFIFRLTLPSDHPLTLRIFKRAKDLNVDSLIRNDGPVTFKQLPEAFIRCGIVFHPSLLETFSATYLEAMAMGRPILASDLPFAREVCGDAALYFSPMSPTDAAMKLIALVTDHSLPTKLVDEGYRRVKAFPNSIQRFRLQQALIRGCVERSAAHSRAT